MGPIIEGAYVPLAHRSKNIRSFLSSAYFFNRRAFLAIGIVFATCIVLFSQLQAQDVIGQKAVVLTFDDGWKNQVTSAVPIMDKYGYKATFFIVCNYQDKEGRMTWDDVSNLGKFAHDIQSHTMNHRDLAKLSMKDLEYEVGESKKCLREHGFPNVTIIATPMNSGWDNVTVVNMTSKYYDSARSGNGEPMFLNCDKWNDDQKDCRTYYDNGTLTFANRYSVRGWSHNFYDKKYAHDTNKILEEFISVVERQTQFNTNGSLEALPVLIYHKVDDKGKDAGTTTTELFEKEMQYLHDNGFKVLTMADLHYDEGSNRFYVPNFSSNATRSPENTTSITSQNLTNT